MFEFVEVSWSLLIATLRARQSMRTRKLMHAHSYEFPHFGSQKSDLTVTLNKKIITSLFKRVRSNNL